MVFFFPQDAGSASEKEYYSQLKTRTLLVLTSIVHGGNASGEVKKIDSALFGLFKPKQFIGREGAEAQHIRRYEEICAVVAQATGRNPKEMKTREFFYILNLLREQGKKAAKHGQPNQGKRHISG